MAKTASKTQSGGKTSERKGKSASAKKTKPPQKASGRSKGGKSGSSKRAQSDFNAADAITKLLESPLVADLLAVGATAALAAIAENRFSRSGNDPDRRASRAVKAAAKAAAAAMGRRIATEFEEIRKASQKAKDGEAA